MFVFILFRKCWPEAARIGRTGLIVFYFIGNFVLTLLPSSSTGSRERGCGKVEEFFKDETIDEIKERASSLPPLLALSKRSVAEEDYSVSFVLIGWRLNGS